MTSHCFQTFWFGPELSPYEHMCLASFIKHGHKVQLFSYSNISVPVGVENVDAREILPEDKVFFYKRGAGAGSVSAFSNVFRYKLLSERGGWWIDTDLICLSPDAPKGDFVAAYEDLGRINGAIIFCREGDPLIRLCLEQSLSMGDDIEWGAIGPALLTVNASALGYSNKVLPMHTCYPVHYTEATQLLMPSKRDILAGRSQGSFCLHLWNEIFRRKSIEKAYLPPKGSFLRSIADMYPDLAWTGEYEADFFESDRICECTHELAQEVRQSKLELLNVLSQVSEAQRLVASEAFMKSLAKEFLYEQQRWGLPYKLTQWAKRKWKRPERGSEA